MNLAYDVVVIGGGTAGVCAAVQAGRAGARTLLVERTSRLGGTIVNGGVSTPGLFHAHGRQVIAGIGWELVKACVEEAGDELPDFTDLSVPRFRHRPVIDPYLYAALCDEAVLGCGCELMLHTMLAMLDTTVDGWRVTICAKQGLDVILANQVIDCSGDCTAVHLAGGPIALSGSCQPATLCCRLSGYALEDLELDILDAAFADAVAKGRLQGADACWNAEDPKVSTWLRRRGMNANHVVAGIEAGDSRGRSLLEVDGRRSVRRLVRWLRTQPGLEHLRVETVFPEVGVRETARIYGEETVTADDYVSGRVFEEALCYAYSCIDQHGVTSDEWEVRHLDEGVVPTVPRGALVPKGMKNLLVAGRIIAADRLAFSALRVQATCMATGQAAGALAALAARRGLRPTKVGLDEARAVLVNHGAIVPVADG